MDNWQNQKIYNSTWEQEDAVRLRVPERLRRHAMEEGHLPFSFVQIHDLLEKGWSVGQIMYQIEQNKGKSAFEYYGPDHPQAIFELKEVKL